MEYCRRVPEFAHKVTADIAKGGQLEYLRWEHCSTDTFVYAMYSIQHHCVGWMAALSVYHCNQAQRAYRISLAGFAVRQGDS